jgi:DNA repair protein RadC
MAAEVCCEIIQQIMETQILASECFNNRHMWYYFDFCLGRNLKHFITLSRLDHQSDGTQQRRSVTFFEEDFEFLIQAFSSLFSTAAYQKASGILPQQPRQERVSGIKSWDPECRPREKLMAAGRDAMADAELLAMLIGSGSPRETAVALAARILASVEFDLSRLAALKLEQLCEFKGMGHAKSLAIISSMELARRLSERQHKKVWLKAL